MQVKLSDKVQSQLEEIKKKDKKLAQRIEKQLILFSSNPKHLSLRIHKLSGKLKNLYSISITSGFRMIYVLSGNEAYFTKIGTHDEVYKNN